VRLRSLKDAGLKAMNIYNCWLGRRLPPLGTRDHLMCEYTGENNASRSTATKWVAEEYAKAVGKITSAPSMALMKNYCRTTQSTDLRPR
jgi:hypothetical protein